MEGEAKNEKIAAAKKKLKEFQDQHSRQNNLQVQSTQVASPANPITNHAYSFSNVKHAESEHYNIVHPGVDRSLKTEYCVIDSSGNSVRSSPDSDKRNETSKVSVDQPDPMAARLASLENRMMNNIKALDIAVDEKTRLITQLESLERNYELAQETIQKLSADLSSCEKTADKMNLVMNQLGDHRMKIAHLESENVQLGKKLREQQEQIYLADDEIKNKNQRLDMLQLKVVQLGGDVDEVSEGGKACDMIALRRECDELRVNYSELCHRVAALTDELEKKSEDSAAAMRQQHQYALKLVSQCDRLNEEKSALVDKLEAQTEHISQLERNLQNMNSSARREDSREREQLQQQLQKMEEKNQMLVDQLQTTEESKKLLEEEINALHSEMREMEEENVKMAAALESQRVAASQAMQQNNKLKDALQKSIDDKEMLEIPQDEPENKQLDDKHCKMVRSQQGDVEPIVSLQMKLKNVVDAMADLTDEKQQLEHLVTQLHSETETIGEYVALYQKQRLLLQQKSRESEKHCGQLMQHNEQLRKTIAKIILLVPQNQRIDIEEQLNDLLTSPIGPSVTSFNEDAGDDVQSCPCCSGKLLIV